MAEHTSVDSSKGGGPNTTAGKAASATNATRHGVFSTSPVAGGESAHEWNAFLDGCRQHFGPVGAHEEELVTGIAYDWWALRRVRRSTTAHIALEHEETTPLSAGPPESAIFVNPQRVSELFENWRILNDSVPLSDVSDDLKRAILGAGRAPEEWARLPIQTVSDARHLITLVANETKVTEEQLVVRAAGAVRSEIASRKQRARVLAERRTREVNAILPAPEIMERHLRYQTTIERALARKVGLLETSQLARSKILPPPIRVAINEG